MRYFRRLLLASETPVTRVILSLLTSAFLRQWVNIVWVSEAAFLRAGVFQISYKMQFGLGE